MGLRGGLLSVAVAAAVVASSIAGPASSTPAGGGASTEPHLTSFACSADAAHVIGVSLYGDTYRGYVNWVPEHFVSPPGSPWTVEYGDGVVRLTVLGMYLPLPGQPSVRGTMELTARVDTLHPTVTRTGVGPGSGDSNDQHVYLQVARALELVRPAHVAFDNGRSYDVSGCTGSVVSRTMERQSDPRARVATGAHTGGWCDPTVNGTRVDELSIDTTSEPWSVMLATYDDRGTPDDVDDDTWATYWSDSGVTLDQLAAGLTLDLTGESWPPPEDGEPATATLSLHWEASVTSRFSLVSGTWTQNATVTSGPLTGVARYGDGASVELTCLAYRDSYRYLQAGGGAPGGGAPPRNDSPAGAVPLAGTTTVQTSGTALEAEQPNPCTVAWDERPDYRATHTVWYTLTGDGPTTVDTAGSRFDTAIAVYTRDGSGSFVPLDGACNDDSRVAIAPGLFGVSLQARSTFDAEPGTVYYVQVGGVSSDDNYGALQLRAGQGA